MYGTFFGDPPYELCSRPLVFSPPTLRSCASKSTERGWMGALLNGCTSPDAQMQ